MNRNVESIDVPLLRAFRALVDESSVTRAAHLLGMSQPAMSAQLKKLREVFRDPILTRTAGGSRPTERASDLIGPVREVLRRIELLAASPAEGLAPSDYQLTVKITATDYAQRILLNRILAPMREKAPGVRLEFRRADRTQVREWMEQGLVDLGIGPMTVPSGRLHFRRLYRDNALCILGPGTLAADMPLTLDAYCGLAHVRVVPARESYFDDAVTRRLAKLGRKRQVVLTVPDFLALADIVRGAPVGATVPRTLLQMDGHADGFDVRPLPFSLPDMQVGLYWHDRTHNSAVHKWLRAIITETFRTAGR
ncbi:LysR family transcriptional regulator [Pigmentiphaga soli]